MMLWISAFAPTSMPRVGSSRIRQFRTHRQPAREQHLLLVAAGELADRLVGARAFDAEPLNEFLDHRALLRGVDDAGPGELRQQRQRQIFGDRHVGNDAFELAVLGGESDAAP